MQRKFIIYLLAFFVPVILVYGLIEYAAMQLPISTKYVAEYMNEEADAIEVLVLGSSQMKGGINPAFMTSKTLNLAGGNQHHDTDFKILQQLINRFPKLKTVVLETSYSHFELPHNGKHFWKNSVYLKYYGVNNFERPTYFKDELIYLSNPKFISDQMVNYYATKEILYGFNRFGYDTLNYDGLFKDLHYDEAKISEKKVFKINKIPSAKIFETNTELFFKMLAFLEAKNLNVVLCKAPMYKTFLPQRVPEILSRRDSIVAVAKARFDNVSVLSLETDTIHYNVRDYWNQSHLNPTGAKKFTISLDAHIQNID
jgi:hypothetical protein|tara:strand:- start:187231 stop:188169 length:939 start_codon:yes stop_codon:yes gene_type:complete